MKKNLILWTVMLVGLAACSEQKQVATEGITKEQISFPIGDRIDNSAFTGEAYLKPLINVDSVFNFPQTNVVTFCPGAHSSAQILRRGDVLQIPAGVRHWHGATKDNWFSQVVIYDSAWKPAETYNDNDNSISDEYYNGLEMEEYAHQTTTDSLMFAAPDSTLSLPTFNGPIRLANTVDAPNVAGSPGLHYVVFEPGVINAWHTHPGGQILIATDGIGL